MPHLPASASAPPTSWFRRRVLDPLVGLLRQGLAPEQLALTVALGVVVGVLPLLGGTTLLAVFVALRLRLNVAALQLICHLLTPLQLLLLLPLLRLGARLLGGATAQDMTVDSLRHLLATNWRGALRLLWRAELGALLLWLVGGAVAVGVLYVVLKPVFRRLAARTATEPA
ncbi:DUF2062 domain-containing protein [Hymenobacter rubidus]|uniref:DUF2062 domain-containing protein n=1 Tax=Hymenobacter rubidus TaxID=1441626 RepID=UPI00191DFCA2|nr:DUF2062 domain-containing protein [Hymenobacter rubidus]